MSRLFLSRIVLSCLVSLSLSLSVSLSVSLFLSLFLSLSLAASVFFLCLSLFMSVSVSVSLSPCLCLRVVWCVWCCGGLWCVVVCVVCVCGVVSPCVRSKRLRVLVQNVPVCTGTTRTCVTTCGRGAGTHGDVLNLHTEVFGTNTRKRGGRGGRGEGGHRQLILLTMRQPTWSFHLRQWVTGVLAHFKFQSR